MNFEKIIFYVLLVYSIISTINGLKWLISCRALVMYILETWNTAPNENKLRACSDKVVKKMINDLIRIEKK